MRIEIHGVTVDGTANPELFTALALKGARALIARSPITGQALRIRNASDARARAEVLFTPCGLKSLVAEALREGFPEVPEKKISLQAEKLAAALQSRGAAKSAALAWISSRASRHELFELIAYWGEKPQKGDFEFDFEGVEGE